MADEEDNQAAMIRWLGGQTADVRHYVVGYLNWDNCERVLEWIVTQEDCDAATAKAIFWGCDPVGILSRSQAAPTTTYARLAGVVCERFASGCYANTGLADSSENFVNQSQRLRVAVANRQGALPFTPPTDFFELHKGRRARVSKGLRAEHNPELRDLLRKLGTDVSASLPPDAPPGAKNQRDLALGLLWLGVATAVAAGALVAKCRGRKPS